MMDIEVTDGAERVEIRGVGYKTEQTKGRAIEMIPALQDGKPSGNVHSYGYDPESRTLAVLFLDKDKKSPGSLYHYHNAEPHHFTEISKPDVSVGSYLHQYFIKPKRRFTKQ